jgi:RNase adaptor protein for sRNA GlmZ degradation
MPRGPKGEKRHADVNRNAVLIAKIATGEIADDLPSPESEGKNPAAVALGRMGGKARAAALGQRKRKEIARQAAKKRWEKQQA